MDKGKKTVVWFRNDLRLEDHPALLEASIQGQVVLLYIYDERNNEKFVDHCVMGEASFWWLQRSLMALQKQLGDYSAELVIRVGDPKKVLIDVVKETHADAVYWNRRYNWLGIRIDQEVQKELTNHNIIAKTFRGNLLFEPWNILNKSNKPFQVFTPFWKACLQVPFQKQPFPSPQKLKAISCRSQRIEDVIPPTKSNKNACFDNYWTPGALGARKTLQTFIEKGIENYAKDRDYPALSGVSLLSPHLHFGEISPHMIWNAVASQNSSPSTGEECFLRQLGWREFAHHLVYHFPELPHHPLRKEFSCFPWKDDPKGLKAWQEGQTGYPIVDASMRQLKQTGWMHNRARMIVGSFLVKDLLINWSEGAEWFWHHLLDADLANNTLGWQWISGCGPDAAPYFRIFNPVVQGQKFDPSGDFVRSWVPELRKLSDKWIHSPWCAPEEELLAAGIELGKSYPFPIVDHAEARDRALLAFKRGKAGYE